MGNKRFVKNIFVFLRSEIRYLVFNTKLILLPVLLILINGMVAAPLVQNSKEIGFKLSCFEPFLALTNSGMVLLMLPLAFITILADYPQVGKVEVLSIFRSSKRIYVCGNLLFSTFAIIVYLTFLLLASMLMIIGHGSFTRDFSDAVTKYLSVFPDREFAPIRELVPPNLYNQFYLYHALLITFSTLFLYLFLLTNILLFFTVINRRLMGIVCNVILIAVGTFTVSIKIKAMWLFPMAHTIPWLHFTEYYSKPVFPMEMSFVYLIVFNVIMIMLSFIFARKFDIIKNAD
ncbi:MAG: hypothetical protein IKR27_09750 [Lachnospiraceae bacterium]|nr:hypothetical protein [Lachnospiraceae bacterium]